MSDPGTRTKAQRRADRQTVGRYYEEQLATLLERIRAGFERYDAGELDAFELDDLIWKYKRATRELWKFCSNVTGVGTAFVAPTILELEADGDAIDWWERGNPERPRR